VQLGVHVPNARAHIFKASNIRAIMGLHNVRAGITVNACKVCRHIVTMRLQCSVSIMDHSSDIATVPSDSTTQCHTAD
jgi:hypothetical protein